MSNSLAFVYAVMHYRFREQPRCKNMFKVAFMIFLLIKRRLLFVPKPATNLMQLFSKLWWSNPEML